MSKYKPPAPTLQDAYKWLPFTAHKSMFLRVVLYPPQESGRLFVAVECILSTKSGAYHLWRRWGEAVSVNSEDQVKGALLRACIQCSAYFEGKDRDEVLRMVEWDVAAMS